MELLLGFMMHIILEPLLYAYVDLVEYRLSTKKLKTWQKNLLMCLCVVVIFISFMLIIMGILFCLDEEDRTAGIAMLAVGVVALVVQCILAVFSYLARKGRIPSGQKYNSDTPDGNNGAPDCGDSKDDDFKDGARYADPEDPKPIVRYNDEE